MRLFDWFSNTVEAVCLWFAPPYFQRYSFWWGIEMWPMRWQFMTVLLNDEIMEFDVVKDSGGKTLLNRVLTDWSFSFELSFGMLMFNFGHLPNHCFSSWIFEIFGFWDEIFDFDSVNALWKPFQKGKLCIEECLLCQTYLHINIGMDKNSLILSSCLVAMLQWKFRHLTLVNNFSIFTVKKIKETDKNWEI